MRFTRLPARLGRSLWTVLLREGPVLGLWAGKATAAAVVSFVVADALGTSVQPVLAPLTALLVVQVTMYDTVQHSVQRVASVLAGVLVAVGLARFVGLTWWSLGAVVAVALLLGMVLRLGPQLLEVPISAMLVLAVGGAEDVALGRVYETLLGAGIGVLVNLAIPAPLYARPAGRAVADLAGRMAGVLGGLAGGLRSGWSRESAGHWLNEARALAGEVAGANRSLERAEHSARLNPRAGNLRQTQPLLRTALIGLEHAYLTLRNLIRALFDRTYFVPPDEQDNAYDEEERAALADVLEAAAAALRGVTALASGAAPVDVARAEVEERLSELWRRRDLLSQLLVVDPGADRAAWQQHGALLESVDRLRVEIEAAVRPSEESWRPPPIGERPRQAIRRVMDHRPGGRGGQQK